MSTTKVTGMNVHFSKCQQMKLTSYHAAFSKLASHYIPIKILRNYHHNCYFYMRKI